MSGEEWIKYVTQEFVQYMDQSQEERRQQKTAKRRSRGKWTQHMFGVLPTSLFMLLRSMLHASFSVLRLIVSQKGK